MGFKITKGKSWKNAGKKTGNKLSKGKTWKDAGKSTGGWLKDDVGGKKTGEWFKDNGKAAGDGIVKLGDKETWEGAGNDAKKTWNAASKGLGRGLGGLSDSMSNALLAGGLVLGGFLVYSMVPSKSRKIDE